MKIKLALLIIVVLAFFLRLLWLDKIPAGISDDGLDYVFNAKAIFLTGKDITQTWSPFSLSTPPLEYPKAELPYLIVSPFIGIADFSLFAARFPYTLFSVALVVIVFLIALRLFGKGPAIATGLLAAINPWEIYFGRTSFDAPLAVFFLFFGFYILLVTKGWKIFLSFPLFFLGFFMYIGIKVIFIPFVILALLFSWYCINQKKYTRQYILLSVLCLLMVFYFAFSLKGKENRISELSTPFQTNIEDAVIKERKSSIQIPLTGLFINKFTIYSEESLTKFLDFYSPQFLFIQGDSRSTFSLWHHGMFYYLDALFLVIGLYAFYRTNRKTFLFFLGMLLITPLPSVLSNVGTTYPIRASLAFPVLVLIIGYGIYYLISAKQIHRYRTGTVIIVICLYFISLLNFMDIYLFRNPIYNSEGFGFSGRVLSRYVDLAQKQNKNVILLLNDNMNTPPPVFKQYLFYTNQYDKNNFNEITKMIKDQKYIVGSVKFLSCVKYSPLKNAIIITVHNSKCASPDKKLSIAQLSDGGEIYSIYNDSICGKYTLNRFPYNINMNDFDVEKLSEEDFCTKFITNLN